MSSTQTILRSYRAPRVVAREWRARGADEALVMTWLFVACILFFVARMPGLRRETFLAGDETPFVALALPAFYGAVLLAPLVFYLLAALAHLIARAFGGKGRWIDARIALFWSLLAVTPLVLLRGMVAGFIGEGPELIAVSAIAFLGFLYLWINAMVALEGQAS